MMGVFLTLDHRVNDGATTGAFLSALVDRLERSTRGSLEGDIYGPAAEY
jgi:pyruvate/2-oxoglutarate dehydrogenase complex dihydrolipoamide acyltransferase (E2) component